MTVEQDLKKALASAQVALGTCNDFAQSTQDPSAKQMFKDMAGDLERHVSLLNTRIEYLKRNNPLNQPGGGAKKQE